MELFWLIEVVAHSIANPDTAFVSFMAAGWGLSGATLVVVACDSAVIISYYYFNKAGIKFFHFVSQKALFKFSRGSKLSGIKEFFVERAGILGRGGYLQLVLISLIIWPGLRETALLIGQTRKLRFTLPVVCLSSAVRLAAIFGLTYYFL